MNISLALCTVALLTGCVSVPAPRAEDASRVEPTLAGAEHAQLTAATPSAELEKTELDARLLRIHAAQSAIAAGAHVAIEQEKVHYLRTLLPEQSESTCQAGPAFTSAELDGQSISLEFEQAVAAPSATYDEAHALSLYEASRAKAAERKTLEFDCLVAEFDALGGNEDTRRAMSASLKSLEQRQKLISETGIDSVLPCLDAAVEQYQSRIAEAYQQFSKQPALATQAQLHRDLQSQYDAEVACLQSANRPRKTAEND